MKSIVQIELTNHCNRRCSYCGQINMKRDRGFMSLDTVYRCIDILHQLKQTTVGLHHFGESLLHPQFLDIVSILNPRNITPWLNTNGDLLTDSFIERLAKVKLQHLVISGHAEQAKIVEKYKKCSQAGIKAWWQNPMADNASNLANQVTLANATDNSFAPLKNPQLDCKFLREEMCCVLQNGDLVACCFDYEGITKFGNIHDAQAVDLVPKVSKLCATCPGHPSNE